MNIVGTVVGMTLMASASPMVMNMAIAPAEAIKRSANFSVAEASAVTFAAANEGAQSLSEPPENCTTTPLQGNAYSVTCTEGEGKYVQSVTRAFRLMPEEGSSGPRQFPHESRALGAHQCHVHDPWGINWRRDWPTLDQCIPQVLWNKDNYLNSNPDDWLWDVNRMKGYGTHPLY